jgi:hypothetical protein
MWVPNHKKENRRAVLFAVVIIALLVFSVVHAITASAAHAETSKPKTVSIMEPNVYVRAVLGPNGPIYTVASQYASDGNWDDCDLCAKYLREHKSFYRLKLPKNKVVQGASYCYSSLKTNAPRCNPEWSGKSRLLKKKPGKYLSEIFYAYYDGDVPEAPEGLCDPTLRREVCPK